MIEGHGDDAYRYSDIRTDFSSNICIHDGHEELMAHLASRPGLIGHYPEPEAWSVERMIAGREGIGAESVIVTSGATEAIYLVAQTFRMESRIVEPTFSEYADACRMFPPEGRGRRLWICNPNNPTGTIWPREQIEGFIRDYDVVVIDQSYEQYGVRPVMSARDATVHDNVIQIHSMTKTYGVPGLRLGYIVASERLAAAIRRNLRPWSVSALAIEAAKFLLSHDGLVCKPDLAEAQRLNALLNQIEGISAEPTQTNFMLCSIEGATAAELKDYLASEPHRMLIRDASNFGGLTAHHFRVAAQTEEEDNALAEAIKQFSQVE